MANKDSSDLEKKQCPKPLRLMRDGGRVVQTNCFECHSKCGVLVYVDANERVHKVTVNPDNPQTQGAACSKFLAGKHILYHLGRVDYSPAEGRQKDGRQVEAHFVGGSRVSVRTIRVNPTAAKVLLAEPTRGIYRWFVAVGILLPIACAAISMLGREIAVSMLVALASYSVGAICWRVLFFNSATVIKITPDIAM